MTEALEWIERLRGTNARDDVLDAIWNLRDLAYDRPEVWQGFTAELLFQALAEEVDRTPGDAVDWDGLTTLLAASLANAAKWSRRKGE